MHVYEVKHPVAHTADDMYALVAHVEAYPQFLPLIEGLTVNQRDIVSGKDVLIATMQVGYKLIRESFTTKVTLDAEESAILVGGEDQSDLAVVGLHRLGRQGDFPHGQLEAQNVARQDRLIVGQGHGVLEAG